MSLQHTAEVDRLTVITDRFQLLTAEKFADVIHASKNYEIIFENSDFTYFEVVDSEGIFWNAVQGHVSCAVMMALGTFQ